MERGVSLHSELNKYSRDNYSSLDRKFTPLARAQIEVQKQAQPSKEAEKPALPKLEIDWCKTQVYKFFVEGYKTNSSLLKQIAENYPDIYTPQELQYNLKMLALQNQTNQEVKQVAFENIL
jgi:hypothetical protein